jgi:hypothetical protein
MKLSAMVVLGVAVVAARPAAQNDAGLLLREAREAEAISGDLRRAATLYEQAAREAGTNRWRPVKNASSSHSLDRVCPGAASRA